MVPTLFIMFVSVIVFTFEATKTEQVAQKDEHIKIEAPKPAITHMAASAKHKPRP